MKRITTRKTAMKKTVLLALALALAIAVAYYANPGFPFAGDNPSASAAVAPEKTGDSPSASHCSGPSFEPISASIITTSTASPSSAYASIQSTARLAMSGCSRWVNNLWA